MPFAPTNLQLTHLAVTMKSTTSSTTSVVKPVPKPGCAEGCECCGIYETCGCNVFFETVPAKLNVLLNML